MTLENEALAKQSDALSRRSSDPLGLEGERWRLVVTLGGREVYSSPLTDDLGSLGSSVFLPGIFGGSFSLWLVGKLFRGGTSRSSGWVRIKHRSRLVKDGTVLVPILPDGWTPSAKVVRRSLYKERTPYRGFRGKPNRASSLRPNPEVYTRTRVSARNRNGEWLALTAIPYNTYARTWFGVRTPNFGKTKRKMLPVNPHSVLLWQQSEPSQYHEEYYIPDGSLNWWVEYFGDPGTLNLPGSISHDERARFQAIRRIIDRAENGIEGNVAQDVVQMKQVVNTMQTSMERIAKAVKYVRQKHYADAKEVLWTGKAVPRFKVGRHPDASRSLADNWLAFQYGWKPLLQDVHGAAESLSKFYNDNYDVRQVKASGKSKDVSRTDIVTYDGHVSGVLHTTVESRCKIGLRFRTDNRLTSFLAQTGFTNPVNLAWEVLPYSFVVDWFLPIGPWLETLSAWDGLTFIDGFQTQFTRKRHQAVINSTWRSGNYVKYVEGDYEAEGIKLDRIKLQTFPAAVFPTFKNPISTIHALNALALMNAAFHGHHVTGRG